jgi:beta-glucosidase
MSGLSSGHSIEVSSSSWMDTSKSSELRAQELISEMTIDEKLIMLHGIPNGVKGDVIYVGLVKGNERLGIPQLRLNDGYVYIYIYI